MAKTAFATNNALTKKLWVESLYRDIAKVSYFDKMSSEGQDSIIQIKRDLQKSQGDTMTFGLIMELTGNGVTSGQTLEGNEEALSTYDFSITLEQYRHAVRSKSKLDAKRPMFSIDTESEAAIKRWGAMKRDKLMFAALQASPTKTFWINGGAITASGADTSIVATDTLTLKLLSQIKVWAKNGGGRSQVPMRPVMIGGEEFFVYLTHDDSLFDLKQTSEFQQAMREAQIRGATNPLFRNATAVWDNIVIHTHENIELSTTFGSGANVAGVKSLFLGAQAGVIADGQAMNVIQRDFDYGNEQAYAIEMISAFGKAKFNSKDFAVISVHTARTLIN